MISINTGQKLNAVAALTRINRPIGIFLLLWPTLWALWFAAEGVPHLGTLLIFIVGTVLTRSAGCAINDYADRDIDAHVARTRLRPLATGALSANDALWVTGILMVLAFGLVLLTNALTIMLSPVALLLALIYPFTKRYTHLPQLVLGTAFAWAIPMAFAAQLNQVPSVAWYLFAAAVMWTTAYDTLYAMSDREDDVKMGIKSSAVLLGRYDLWAVGLLQILFLALLSYIGVSQDRGLIFVAGIAMAGVLAARQLWLCRQRDPARCLQAFLNNNWLGMIVFVALFIDYLVR